MFEFRIPSALALVASLALVGCGDLGTGPSVDGPEFRGGPTRFCPPGFDVVAVSGAVQEAVDHNGDDMICVNGRGGMADNVVPGVADAS